ECSRRCLRLLCTDPPPAETSPLSLHDALPICTVPGGAVVVVSEAGMKGRVKGLLGGPTAGEAPPPASMPPEMASEAAAQHQALRSEEHTSELQSRENLVCRLLLEKKNRRGTTH